jgi:hypothetical protein
MAYQIQSYTKEKARALGLRVKPSKKQFKKLDVFDSEGGYLASVGDVRYSDYPTYKATKGKAYADQRRQLYLARHAKDQGTAGRLAKILLW